MIERSSNSAQAILEGANYDAINAILDAVETVFLSIAVEHRLRGIETERWRWDQPEIVMSWFPVPRSTDVGKNIRIFVKMGGPTHFICAVESNAWFDEHEGDTIVRHWGNFAGSTVNITDPRSLAALESRLLKERIDRAYDQFSSSTEIAFTQAVRLFSNGHPELIEQDVHLVVE